jgi:hypothetical protein
VLTGVLSGRPADEALEGATWKEWAAFEPIPGVPQGHQEYVYGMHRCTHCFEDEFQGVAG